MRKRDGFTLTEILISILIIGIVMSAVITLLVSVFKSYEFHQDISEAKQRGQIAIAAIEPLVVNAGLGMPADPEDFKAAFNGLEKLLPPDPNKQFTGPVQIAIDDERNITVETTGIYKDKLVGNEIWVVYSVPSGYGNSSNIVDFDPSVESILLAPDSFESRENEMWVKNTLNNNNIKSWITFPTSSYPFVISDFSSVSDELTVQSFKKQSVFRNDELHYVRAAKIKVENNNLEIDHTLTGGFQPVVEGIHGLLCVYDRDDSRILTVTILARADTMRPELNITTVDGWTGAIPNNKYRYAAVSKSWRIRN